MTTTRGNIKREIDLQTMVQWIAPECRVLDLGCGRGVFLEHLALTRGTYGIGIDKDRKKISGCIKRDVNAYQGTVEEGLSIFEDNSFDWVICSRMLHEIDNPYEVLTGAMRVGHHVAVGFVNFGFWATRMSILSSGQRPQNEVYPHPWHYSKPYNPLSIRDFEQFCEELNYQVTHRVYLDRTWRSHVKTRPNLNAGYAVYAITR